MLLVLFSYIRRKTHSLCITKASHVRIGKETVVQTAHKPLETILRKPLWSARLRLQTMMLKVKGYDLKFEYLPGKKQVIADTLSRASLNEVPPKRKEFQVNMLERISVTQEKYQELQQKLPMSYMNYMLLSRQDGSTQSSKYLTVSSHTGTTEMN